MKKIISLMILIFVVFSNHNAQSQNVLIQGKVIDISSNTSVGTKLLFGTDGIKAKRCNSNSSDGSFQQALTPGYSYYVILEGYIPLSENKVIEIPRVQEYTEINKEILVEKIKPNTELLDIKIFEPNDSIIVNDSFVEFLKNFINVNQKAKITLELTSYDSWLKSTKRYITKTNSKGKQYKKRVTYKTKQRLSDLLDARISALKKLLKKSKIFFKDESYIKETKVVSEKKKRKRRLKAGSKRRYEYYIPEISNLKIIVS